MPGTVVMKFGGTSVADAERLKRAAARLVAAKEAGSRVVGVLSARGKTTDELIAMAEEVSPDPDRREMDMLLSTGERISCALCAMAINDLNHKAISLTGSQAGIVTDSSHTKARILDVRADRIRQALGADHIVLVAGFQGVSTERDVTTLGRGGSDTTAVALAAALGGDVCEIYTDVAGVFSADPRIVDEARVTLTGVRDEPGIAGRIFSALADANVNVDMIIQNEPVGADDKADLSFTVPRAELAVARGAIEGLALGDGVHADERIGKVSIVGAGMRSHPGVAAKVFQTLGDGGINIEMISTSPIKISCVIDAGQVPSAG